MGDWEAIVVVDGPDEATVEVLRAQSDERVRYLVNERSLGGGEARNVGVRAARGHWVALLDDDDEWLPYRLAEQLANLSDVDETQVVAFCRIVVRSPHGDAVWPRRAPSAGEHVSDYLFTRRSLFAGEGGIQTSAIIAPRTLLAAVPFDPALSRYQDTDWVLRACAAGAKLRYCEVPLSIWHVEEARSSIASRHARDWEYALRWIQERRALVTPRAYASFLLIRGGGLSAAALSPRGAVAVLREALLHGRPGPMSVLLFAGKWLLPAPVRHRVRRLVSLRR